jgi:hypothetical protein
MFRKEIVIPDTNLQMGYSTSMITLGSCFSDTIGDKLEKASFKISNNPFGTIFHPIALANVMKGLQSDKQLERDNYHFHWQLGGKWYGETAQELGLKTKELNDGFQADLKKAKVVMVTFGTAWGYVLNETGKVVANCHKQAQELFEKRLFTTEEILVVWKELVNKYPAVQWVFTVSPVRHWKDGVRENNVSKGILHHVIHELLNEANVHYFPAYEILLDELRDYRFYESDYLHPSQEAIDYIWKKFRKTYFSQETEGVVRKVEKLNTAQEHQLQFPNSAESKKFLASLSSQKKEVEALLAQLKG